MPNGTKKSRIRPIAGAHSIEQVNFGFEWAEPLAPELLTLLSGLHVEIKDLLPRKQEIRAQQVTIQAEGISGPPVSKGGELVAVVMDELDPDDRKRHELVLQQNALVFGHYSNYTNWSEVRDFAMGITRPLLDALFRERKISVIGLQYVDTFSVAEFPLIPEDIFSRDSDVIPLRTFENRDYWHVHQGFFEKAETPVAHRRLTNIDIDFKGGEQGDRVMIKCLHRALLPKGFDESFSFESIAPMHEVLHDENKRILRSVLTQDVQEQIGLTASKEK